MHSNVYVLNRRKNKIVRGFIYFCSLHLFWFLLLFNNFYKNIPWMTFKTCCRLVSYYSKLNWYNITCIYGIMWLFCYNSDSSFYYTRHVDVILFPRRWSATVANILFGQVRCNSKILFNDVFFINYLWRGKPLLILYWNLEVLLIESNNWYI